MNKRLIWPAIHIILLPYLALFVVLTTFLSVDYPFFEYIMCSVFKENALIPIALLLLYCLITLILSIAFFIRSIHKEWDSLSLIKSALVIKLFQIPAYILIFIIGFILAITIFTIPFTIGLFLIDFLTLVMSSLFTLAAIITSIRRGIFTSQELLEIIILEFVFVADIVVSFIFLSKLKKKLTEANE